MQKDSDEEKGLQREITVEGYTDQPFPQALGELLRQHYGDAMGRYPLGPFIAQVENRTGLKYEYIRLMLRDERTLRSDVIEAASEILGVEPTYFVEYREHCVKVEMTKFPELVNLLYEATTQFLAEQKARAS